MPVLTLPNLATGRFAVRMFVGAPAALNEERQRQGQPSVSPVEATALIDTGAARTLIADSLIGRLGLPVLGDAPSVFGIGSGGSPIPAASLAVSLALVDGPPALLAATAFQVSAVADQELTPLGVQVLLGRDFLARVVMIVYNGPEDRLTLAF
jgi:hypothetical protein